MAHIQELHSEPRLKLRPLLGPGDDSTWPPGCPEYYVDRYGVSYEEAVAFIHDVFLDGPTVLGSLYRRVV